MFTKEDTSNLPLFSHRTENTIDKIEITQEEMEKRLSSLNPSKSEGPDGIHPRILKELKTEVALPLKILFRKNS